MSVPAVRRTAVLEDGRSFDYDEVPDPPAGGMKITYFTPDRSHVVQFFKNVALARDGLRRQRLQAVLGKWNVTKGDGGPYWERLFVWPQGVVVQPELGLVALTFRPNFFMTTTLGKRVEKKARWFTSPKSRKLVPDDELGNWLQMLRLSLLVARAVSKLNRSGLAHGDISANNVLIDPKGGEIAVLDIDSIVVPGISPPDVLGTKGYIAPEVLATQHLAVQDKNRRLPSARADEHALAVLIYEMLLRRHPLRGPKVHHLDDQQDELLSMGEKAMFIEHPTDPTNHPKERLDVPYTALGKALAQLVEKSFVKGLHDPDKRPAASEWERALVKTWDLMHPCANAKCRERWFALQPGGDKTCPFCHTKVTAPVPMLKLLREARGSWSADGEVVLYHNLSLYGWHARSDRFPGETADRTPLAYCALHNGRWVLVNQRLQHLKSPAGNPVPPNGAVELKDGVEFRLSDEPNGRKVMVQMLS